ncbi:MAG: hypothetical protein KGL39_48745 [Patescibacteria group bacterium]|nr:hypothetical protein [Patescibacteria group bacterium]
MSEHVVKYTPQLDCLAGALMLVRKEALAVESPVRAHMDVSTEPYPLGLAYRYDLRLVVGASLVIENWVPLQDRSRLLETAERAIARTVYGETRDEIRNAIMELMDRKVDAALDRLMKLEHALST